MTNNEEGGWYFHSTGPFAPNYSQPKPPPAPIDAEQMTPEQLANVYNDLGLKKLRMELHLIGTQIELNQMTKFAQHQQMHALFLAELRQLTMTWQIDIENTIMMSEPKYKPLFDGVQRENLNELIEKIVMKLTKNLDIK